MATATHSKLLASGVQIENKRLELIDLLNARLVDTVDLKTQAKQAHWNVKGPQFQQLHELFDQVAAHSDEASDLLAERVTALGGVALGTARIAAAASSLKEYDLNATKGEAHVRALAAQVAAVSNASRAGD